MDYEISAHALESMVERNIPERVVDEVLTNPDQIVPGNAPNNEIYQKLYTVFNKPALVRVAVIKGTTPLKVATVYKTTSVSKYWVGALP